MNDTAEKSQAPILLDPRFEDGTELSDADIRAYLLKNTDFFSRHPDILEQLVIPHDQKGAVSLVELQSEQLRKKTKTLNRKLSQLISIAKQNERIYRIYGDLNLQLMRCESFSDISDQLENALIDKLGLSAVTVRLFKGPHALPEIQQRLLFEKRFQQNEYFFGRLSKHEKHVIFGDNIVAESVSLCLLGQQEYIGILAIGSANAGHFTPDMDTLLLDQLKHLLADIVPRVLPY